MEFTARAFEHWLFQYRKVWRGTVVSGFLEPILYLTAMGVGLGAFIDQRSGPDALGGVSYLEFIAPGLLAATVMMNAVGDSTYPVMGAIRWERTYYAMLATPLRVRDILFGHLAFVAVRMVAVATFYLAVLAVFGALRSPWSVLAIPVAVLTAMAFAVPTFALAARLQRDSGFALLFRFGVIPLFLFSGTFFPVEQLPDFVEPIAYATPLWHGVTVSRGLTLDALDPSLTVINLAYLALWVIVGGWLALKSFTRRLVV